MKQVIVVNESLVLPAGKLAAQVAHAAVGAFLRAHEQAQATWLQAGMPKVVLAVGDEADLIALEDRAAEGEIPAAAILDAGRTVVASGTLTCLGLGPADAAEIDQLTGHLRLL